MKKNNNQIIKNKNIFTFINLYQKPMLFRIFGYESNNNLKLFQEFINNIIKDKDIKNLDNYHKHLSYICHFCKYMQYIMKKNKDKINEEKFNIFDPAQFINIELNDLKKHEELIIILKNFLDFAYSIIISMNNLRNNHAHTNFDSNNWINSQQEKIIEKLYTKLLKFYNPEYKINKIFTNAKQKFYFCLSFFLSHKILNRYLSHFNVFKEVQQWDKYIDIDIISFDYNVMGKWNTNNYVCQNTANNLIKLMQENKNFGDKKSLKTHYKKIWKNIYNILYFHCNQYNNEILNNDKKDNIDINKDNKYVVLYDKYTEIVNYKNIVNNSIRGLITYDKFPPYTLIIFPYKYLINKLSEEIDKKPITITHKMIFDFYFSDFKNNLFEYEDFKKFIDYILNIKKSSNPNNTNDFCTNQNDIKNCFLNRLKSNRQIWGDKLAFLKWSKHFFKNIQNSSQDSENKNEITKLINENINRYNAKNKFNKIYNFILKNINVDKKEEFIKRYQIKNNINNLELYIKNINSMKKSYSYFTNNDNNYKNVYAVSKRDFRYLILFSNFKDMIIEFKKIYSNYINDELKRFIDNYEENLKIDELFNNINEYMWNNHKNTSKLSSWCTIPKNNNQNRNYFSKFVNIINNNKNYKLINKKIFKNTYYLDYQILYLLSEIHFDQQDFINSYEQFLVQILDSYIHNKNNETIILVRNSFMHITDERSNIDTKKKILELLKLYNKKKDIINIIPNIKIPQKCDHKIEKLVEEIKNKINNNTNSNL